MPATAPVLWRAHPEDNVPLLAVTLLGTTVSGKELAIAAAVVAVVVILVAVAVARSRRRR